MATMRVTCPNPSCSAVAAADDATTGQRRTCSRCGSVYVVPEASTAVVVRTAEGQPAVEGEIPTDWQPGDRIAGLYEVAEVLGRGGMGVVYRTRHLQWGVDLAVKSVRPDLLHRADSAEAFERECRTWVQLGLHPHVVSCYYVRQLGGIPRLFAEYLSEGSLAGWLKSGRLYQKGPRAALARVLDIGIQVAWGLEHAHRQGVVHQDVKPANILMAAPQIAKVTDFGIARAQAAIGAGTALRVEAQGLTPQYASPEQLRRGDLTARSDLWSWALTMVEMFAGEATWLVGEIGRAALEPLAEAGPPAPRPALPAAVFRLLWRCLDPAPSGRPESLSAVAAALVDIFAVELGAAYPRALPDPREEAADNLNNRAVSLLDLGREREAVEALAQATVQDRFHPEASYNLGLLRWRRGAATEAPLVAALEQARSARPAQWLPLYLLALVHSERGDRRAANEALAALRPADAERAEVAALRPELAADQPGEPALEGPLHGAHGRLEAAVTSPDGFLLATDERGWLLLWNPLSGQLRHQQLNFRGAAGLCLAPGGSLAWSSHAGGELQSWELGQESYCRAVWPSGAGEVTALALPKARGGVLAADAQGTVRRWAPDGERLTWVAELDSGPVHGMVATRDLVYAAVPGRLLCLTADSGGAAGFLDTGVETVAALATDGAGQWLLTGGDSGVLRLWDARNGTCAASWRPALTPVARVALSHDGRWAASAEAGGAIRWWSVAEGRCRRTVVEVGEPVLALGLTAGGESLVAASRAGAAVWRSGFAVAARPLSLMLSRPVTSDPRTAPERVFGEALRAAQVALAAGDEMGAAGQLQRALEQPGFRDHAEAADLAATLRRRLRRGRFRAAWEVRDLAVHQLPVQALQWQPERGVAVSQAGWTEVRATELAGGGSVGQLDLPPGGSALLGDLAWGADRQLLGAPGEGWQLWDLAGGRALHSLPRVSCATFSPDGRLLLSARLALGHQLEFRWQSPFGRPTRCRTATLPWRGAWAAPPQRLHCAADLRHVLTEHGPGGCYLWDLVRRARLADFRPAAGEVTAVALLRGAAAVAFGFDDGHVELYGRQGRQLFSAPGHQGRLTALCATVDGRTLFSAGDDAAVRIWDLATGELVQMLRVRGGAVGALASDAGGYQLLLGTADGHLRWWRLDWELTSHTSESLALAAQFEQANQAAAAARRTYGVRGERDGEAEDHVRACCTAVGLAPLEG